MLSTKFIEQSSVEQYLRIILTCFDTFLLGITEKLRSTYEARSLPEIHILYHTGEILYAETMHGVLAMRLCAYRCLSL